MDPEERLTRHGQSIARHDVRLDIHDHDIENLWKKKVSVERYIWVERFVVGACGAVLLWAFQHLAAAQAVIDSTHK